MTDFVLVDIHSQIDDLHKYVRGLTSDEILQWMQSFGTVIVLFSEYPGHERYCFEHPSGLRSCFQFDESGKLAKWWNHDGWSALVDGVIKPQKGS